MTPDENKKNNEQPEADIEALKDSIREVLGEILPDFLNNEGDGSNEKESKLDDLDQPLTARNAEAMMKNLMKDAMKELQGKKKPKEPNPESTNEEVEPPPPPKEKIVKEDPPTPPKKRMTLAEMFWGKDE